MARNFSDLQKSKTTRELNNFCKEVAENYAWTADTIGYLMEKHDLTKRGAHRTLAYAVVHYLVDDKTVSKMANKASQNQRGYSSGSSSDRKYGELREERRKESIK